MHPRVINKSPGRNKSGQRRSERPQRTLRGHCLRLHCETQLLPPCPLWPPLLVMTGSHRSGDRSPKIKGPGILLPDKGPSKASRSPLPFLLRSESERVANVHTIFEMALNQTRPSSKWVYDCLEVFFPHKTKEQLVYFSNVLCLSIAEFHLTSGCTPLGMCTPVLLPVVKAELPPLETYLHD